MKKTVQYFNKDYLAKCKHFTPDQIIEFLENYRLLVSKVEIKEKCQPISLKIEPSLLHAFKQKAKCKGVLYQTKIKQLMRTWVSDDSTETH